MRPVVFLIILFVSNLGVAGFSFTGRLLLCFSCELVPYLEQHVVLFEITWSTTGPSWQALLANLRAVRDVSHAEPSVLLPLNATLSLAMNSFIRSDGAIAADFNNYHWTRGNVQLVRDPVPLRSLFEFCSSRSDMSSVLGSSSQLQVICLKIYGTTSPPCHRDWFHVVSFMFRIYCLV